MVKKLNIFKVCLVLIVLILIATIIVKFINKNKDYFQSKEVTHTGNIAELNNETEEVDINKSKLEEKLVNGKVLSEEGLPILMYHFFYDKNKEEGKDGNHLEISKFEEQMKYLSENDFYFPTWQEVEDFIDKKQELPEKSVVITADDGDPSFFELAVPILQKYNIPATSFVITYWYGNRAENKEEGISYQSHSYDMHRAGSDGKGIMLSLDYDKIKEDVLLSREVLGGADIFCYPFGSYTETAINVLKDTNYKLAVTTAPGRVKKGASKYKLPRVRISDDTSFMEFKQKVN